MGLYHLVSEDHVSGRDECKSWQRGLVNDRVRMHRGLCVWKYEHLWELVNTFEMKSGLENQCMRSFGPGFISS